MHDRGQLPRAPLLSRHEPALVGITALWGATFLIVHTAMDHSGPLFFVGPRFLAAGLISVAVCWRTLAGLTRPALEIAPAVNTPRCV